MTRRHPRDKSSPRNSGGSWVYGRHAVLAALANPRRKCHKLITTQALAADLLEGSRALQLPPGTSSEVLSRDEITNFLGRGTVHQGIALQADPLPNVDLETACAPEPGTPSVVAVLDQVTDPQNVGAILRSAAAFGARAVITTERNAPPPAGALAKAASGAIEYVPYVRIVNLSRGLEQLARLGYWRLGFDGHAGTTLADADTTGHIALVFGGEGSGLRHLTAKNCDLLVRLPMSDQVESLNVSNATAVAFYEVARDRA
jgi:23S rRNA (guanosine2251-2'-O)-methyltransferase